MLCYRFVIGSAAFGRNDNVVADIVQRFTDFLFAVSVHIGCVEIIDAVIIGFTQQLFCSLV